MCFYSLQEIMTGFFNEGHIERLVFTVNAASLLWPSYEFPNKPRNKVTYFVKKKLPTRITEENLREVIS